MQGLQALTRAKAQLDFDEQRPVTSNAVFTLGR
jgi:hypothetical protein